MDLAWHLSLEPHDDGPELTPAERSSRAQLRVEYAAWRQANPFDDVLDFVRAARCPHPETGEGGVSHVEFPELTRKAEKALRTAGSHPDLSKPGWHRRYLAAFLREAMKQALDKPMGWGQCWHELKVIADNLHSPPPPPPTLAQVRAADLDTPEDKAVVRDFLATLGEGGQP